MNSVVRLASGTFLHLRPIPARNQPVFVEETAMLARTTISTLTAILLATSIGPSFAEMKIRKVKATRDQVRTACEKNDDNIGYGTHAKKGGYGCVTDNGFIDCKENGECTGGTVERRQTRRLPHMSNPGTLARR
ncbi:MAG: hypothetical protein RIB97_23015 [Nitratireductor sp.]